VFSANRGEHVRYIGPPTFIGFKEYVVWNSQ